MKTALLFLLTATGAFAALPAVGPDYQRPAIAAPAVYREAGDASPGPLQPSDNSVRADWWSLFGDATMNRLEAQALGANQDLRAASSRVEQAAAAAGLARSAYWPQVSADPAVTRGRMSTTTDNPFPTPVTNDFSVPLFASWELDLFGRVRRLNESARDEAAAASDLFESVRLSLTASVATNYFTLRGLDRERVILKETAGLRRRELDLVLAQRRNGAATELDTARARNRAGRQRRPTRPRWPASANPSRTPSPSWRGWTRRHSPFPFRSRTSSRLQFRPESPPSFWSAGRTSPLPSAPSPRPMRESGSPRRPSFRPFP